MDEYESLSHTRWECKYHVVFIPKYRRKTLYGELRRHLGEVFRKLAVQKESKIEEGHLCLIMAFGAIIGASNPIKSGFLQRLLPGSAAGEAPGKQERVFLGIMRAKAVSRRFPLL